MKPSGELHTINYFDTFIEVADDCKVSAGEIPVIRNNKKTLAYLQFECISENPYRFTSVDIIIRVYAEKNALVKSEYTNALQQFFSKGQACFRASPLTKQFSWGVHL